MVPGPKLSAFFFQHFKNLLNEKDDYGCTPLHYASREGYLVALDDLIELGAIVNPKNKDKQSPLHFAARWVTSPQRHQLSSGQYLSSSLNFYLKFMYVSIKDLSWGIKKNWWRRDQS